MGKHGRRRRALRWLHRWIGLALGLPLVLVCLSGVSTSYWHEIDAALHPQFPRGPASSVPLDRIAETAQRACEACGEVLGISPWRTAAVTSVFFTPTPADRADEAVVANADGRLLLLRRTATDPLTVLYRLHSELLAGDAGRVAVGMLAAGFLSITLAGVVMAWPRPGGWRRVFRVRLRRRIGPLVFDLHRVVGLLAALFLFIIAVTGIALAFPKTTASVLGVSEDQALHAASDDGAPVSYDAAVGTAMARFPGASWTWLERPDGSNRTIMVQLKQPGEPTAYGKTHVWIDGGTGTVLGVEDGRGGAAARRLYEYLVPLHSGIAWGSVARGFFAGVAISAIALAASGAWLFGRRLWRLKG